MAEFGTSGLRGLASELLVGVAAGYAQAFGQFLCETGLEKGSIVFVGSDLRESSPSLVSDCCEGLAASGQHPVYCGALPTPALAFHAMQQGAPCLMVTGSHIPADRNGMKFYTVRGEIDKNNEAAITKHFEMLSQQAMNRGDAQPDPNAREAALDRYRDRYFCLFGSDLLKGKRVGVFEHSSVARELMAEIVSRYGGEIVRLGRSDTFVPIDTEALDTELKSRLREWAAEHQLDAIVSTDADADRPLVTDENGSQIRGDALGLATAIALNANTIVTPVTSNSALEKHARFALRRTRVGSPFVLAKMQEAVLTSDGVVIGFEANGGFLLGTEATVGEKQVSALPTRDAMLPILCFLARAFSSADSVSDYVRSLELNEASSGRLKDFSRKKSGAAIQWIGASRANANQFLDGIGKVLSTDDMDGLKLFLESGETLHIRASGNAPEIRCYGEAASKKRAELLVQAGLEKLSAMNIEHLEAGQ